MATVTSATTEDAVSGSPEPAGLFQTVRSFLGHAGGLGRHHPVPEIQTALGEADALWWQLERKLQEAFERESAALVAETSRLQDAVLNLIQRLRDRL